MIKGVQVCDFNDDKWNYQLFESKVNANIAIYRNNKGRSKKYEACIFGDTLVVNTFKKAAEHIIKYLKQNPKYIPDIMRLTALMSVEE